ncbi:hypothetical protein [Rhodococcus sp. 114MFTsu3.1]|uniref:hypothetical protein n=1 Tax=Rhodococcus sp. 114MFTsu3.1 TaxID=1172184 RepID=UPI0003677192|nr:hypothetical protein [Rhodococcus sp. 114MFTsu3.1]
MIASDSFLDPAAATSLQNGRTLYIQQMRLRVKRLAIETDSIIDGAFRDLLQQEAAEQRPTKAQHERAADAMLAMVAQWFQEHQPVVTADDPTDAPVGTPLRRPDDRQRIQSDQAVLGPLIAVGYSYEGAQELVRQTYARFAQGLALATEGERQAQIRFLRARAAGWHAHVSPGEDDALVPRETWREQFIREHSEPNEAEQ